MAPVFGIRDMENEEDSPLKVRKKSKKKSGADTPSKGSRNSAGGESSVREGTGEEDSESEANEGTATSPTKERPMKTVSAIWMVVGLDFGTTHTGISYQSNADSAGNTIHTMVDWHGSSAYGAYLPKMPSRIAYASENQEWGPDKRCLRKDAFGYQVEPGMISYTWFKLLLDETVDATAHDDPHLQDAVGRGSLGLPAGKTAVDVAADYLRHVLEILYKELEKPITKEALQSMSIDFYVTVPAIWSDEAKAKTLEALGQAGYLDRGIDKIKLISEPEAAAIASLSSTHDHWGVIVEENLLALVVDGGGGTVDLEAMKVTGMGPLKLRNVCVGEGGKCGSTQIDREFLALCERKYGENFASVPDVKRGPGSQLMTGFEKAKKMFLGGNDQIFRMHLPSLGASLRNSTTEIIGYDFDEGEIIITGKEMRKLFKPTITGMCELTEKQMRTVKKLESVAVDVIVLCGGLAASEYIWEEFNKFCAAEFELTRVIRPENAWSAISRGAAIYGLNRTMMVGRVARRHYGIQATRQFKPGVDPDSRAYYCAKHGKRLAGTVEWLVTKGEEINPKRKCFKRGYILSNEDEMTFSYDIVASRSDDQPTFVDDLSVSKIGDLDIDISRVIELQQKKRQKVNTGPTSNRPEQINFNIVTTIGADAGMVKIAANANRVNVGHLVFNYARA